MSNTNNFPSKHTGLQQSFFLKAIQSGENNKNQKNQARSDFDEKKRQIVNTLDSRLRQNASIYLSKPASSIESIIDKLRAEAREVTTGLLEKADKQYRDNLANAAAQKLSIQSNSKEQSLLLKWGALNLNRLNVTFGSIPDLDVPKTLEECTEQGTQCRQKIIELGHPSQYGSGRLGRNTGEVIWDMAKGIGQLFIFVIGLFVLAGVEKGSGIFFFVIAIFSAIAWGISEQIGMSFASVFLTMLGLILGVLGLYGGIVGFSSDEEKKEKQEKRKKLIAGYSAYLIYQNAQKLMQGLYEKKIKLLEDQKISEHEDAKKQEVEILNSINDFEAKLREAELSHQSGLQKIETEFQKQQKEMKQEFMRILGQLGDYSKLAIAAWDDVFWQNDVAQTITDTNFAVKKDAGEIRIGQTVYPGSNKEPLPMMVDLAQCGHIFIFATRETEWHATQLLKAITARLVFTTPVGGAKFTFIDTKAAGVFAEYHQLPFKMGNYSFSDYKEIQEQTQSLEQHQKQMQTKVGNGNLRTFNLTAKEPESQQMVCISGFPNSDRFRTEAQSHLENIIFSGARVGIHTVLKISMDSVQAASRPIDQTLFFRHGVVLRPSKTAGQWEVCFNGQVFPFVPDEAPDEAIVRNLIPQIHTFYRSKPSDRPMRVFLCHAFEDKSLVREVYERLKEENWLEPWLSEEGLLPGQEWGVEIDKNMENADAVVLFLSNVSVHKEGYVHREIRKVLDIADEKPQGTIFVIPIRLDECELPNRRLNTLHWLDYFPPQQRKESYQLLYNSLRNRYGTRSSK